MSATKVEHSMGECVALGFFRLHEGHTHAMDVTSGYCTICGDMIKASLDERLTALERSQASLKSSLETISRMLESITVAE